MRRFLAIFLAFAVLFALCVGVGAANSRFTDSKQIQNEQEVLMLTDLGLFSGYEDGSFRPGNTITRAEIAKIMATIDTDSITLTRAATYSDAVPGWAAPYVSYCVQEGILSGYADGSFRASANITGRELAKMLLIVVGYEGKQFTGAKWAQTVDDAAKAAGIYDGYTRDLNLYITREDACSMINNALQCSYISGYDADGKPIYVLDELYVPKSVLQNRFQVQLVTGVIEASAVADLRVGAKGPLTDNLLHVSGYTKNFVVSSQVANDPGILGRKMTLYAQFGTEYNQVLGVPLVRATEIYSTFTDFSTINALLQYAPMTVGERTRFFVNFAPSDFSCLEDKGDGATATIIDQDGDGVIDLILVSRPVLPTPLEPEKKP